MKTKFGKRIELFFNNLKQIKIDQDNKVQYLNDIQQEIIDPKSKFNSLNLSANKDYSAISTVLSIPENYQISGSDIMKYQKLQEYARPINQYINNDLNWGQYFLAPDFYYIDEVNDINEKNGEVEIFEEVSCSYIATWKYAPVLDRYPNFKWEVVAFLGINILLIAAIVVGLIIIF